MDTPGRACRLSRLGRRAMRPLLWNFLAAVTLATLAAPAWATMPLLGEMPSMRTDEAASLSFVGSVNAPTPGGGAATKTGEQPHAHAYAPGIEMPRQALMCHTSAARSWRRNVTRNRKRTPVMI